MLDSRNPAFTLAHDRQALITCRAVLHRVWTHVWNSLYNNVPCIHVVMCVNAIWMCHHWFMHIETHPCLGRSHTRASTIVITVIIRNAFDVHMVLQLFLTPPPKMGRSPRDNNFAILAIIVWAWYLHAALMNPVMKGTTFHPICPKFEIFAANLRFDELDTSPQNAFWWGQRSH